MSCWTVEGKETLTEYILTPGPSCFKETVLSTHVPCGSTIPRQVCLISFTLTIVGDLVDEHSMVLGFSGGHGPPDEVLTKFAGSSDLEKFVAILLLPPIHSFYQILTQSSATLSI